jgi:hypothetical protein
MTMDGYTNASSVCRMIGAGKLFRLKSSGRNNMIDFIHKNKTRFEYGEIKTVYNSAGMPGMWIKDEAIHKLKAMIKTFMD